MPESLSPPEQLSRRSVLKRGALLGGAALGLGLGQRSVAQQAGAERAGADTAPGAIDAHVHVWTPDVKKYPLAAGYTLADMVPKSFTPDELLAQARPAGVARVVLIQMSFYGFENSYMLAAIRDYPGVFSGVAVVDEHAAGLRDTMRALKKQGVRGFRIHPARQTVNRWLFHDDMAAMWKIGAEEKLAMCALINPEALEPLNRQCAKFPDTPVVVDHFARIGMDGTVRDADVDNLCRLAKHKHTYVKVSAFYALGKKQAPYTDLAPVIKRLLSAFGPERLMWATDCPYQVQDGHTYLDSIELVRSRLDFLSPNDRRRLLAGTAQQVFFS